MHYEVAPLEGITTFAYRQLHHTIFGGAERYYTPFFVPTQERKLSTKEQRDLNPAHNQGIEVVPQVLTKRADDVIWAAQVVADMGYGELNLNLGCPAGTVVSKGKGSGLLSDLETLERFLEDVFQSATLPISVKSRVGIQSDETFPAILEVFNRYPIYRLTIHPRVQKDYYKFPVRPQAFDYACAHTHLPLTYNGDLYTLADLETAAQRWPSIDTWMLGRGLVGDPALLRKAQGGTPATRDELERLTAQLYETYREAYGHPGTAAQRMKEVWFYMIHLFVDNQKLDKKMRRCGRSAEYEAIERSIFQELTLKESV